MSEINSKKDPIGGEEKPKTAKQLEKEAKKAAKLAKFNEKKDKSSTKAADATNSSAGVPVKEKKKVEEKKVAVYEFETAPGTKKNVSIELPTQYSPKYVEAAWYDWWKKEGFFSPEYQQKGEVKNGTFVMVIPPPNVTGTLHLGHALTNSVEDAICRWHRMKGETVLWVPGCDHAGIATQVVVEKKLKRESGISRHDLGREKFVEKVWHWKEEKGQRIYSQLESMGSSLDWSRERFTMSPMLQEAVKEAFVRLHEDGDIYRSCRLVNWSCTLKSAISDIEVEKHELSGKTELSVPGYSKKVEFGVLVSFAYKVSGEENQKVVVATTRIETMLGDTAVAVHPDDERYKHLHGKILIHPFTERKLPIVTDDFVDINFGTGCVKITPAHDPNDYEVGKRHDLPFINILTEDGKIVEGYGSFTGLPRFEARVKILEELTSLNLYEGTQDNPMVVPVCSRSKDIIEPMLKPQWYLKCSKMAENATDVVKSGELEIIPKMHNKTWYHWMDEIRDWCISRQLWWGHRIPAYYVTTKGATHKPGMGEDSSCWVSGRTKEEAIERACEKFKLKPDEMTIEQDPDVLDTWFSSALFPFSVMGWPKKTKDLELYYPNTLLETGHDIMFFWVARMVFMGQRLMGCLPFKQVYFHAMVRDAHGRKMSKSLGNVIDPMDVIRGVTLQELHKQLEENTNLDPKEVKRAKEGQKSDYPDGIPECGTDALRFTLCAYTAQGRDINLDVLRVNGYRNFCNKLWNATKFALMNLDSTFKPYDSIETLVEKFSSGASSAKSSISKPPSLPSQSLTDWNKHFAQHSYVDGFKPSLTDFDLLSSFSSKLIDTYPHVWRWSRHIKSFQKEEMQVFSSVNLADQWMLSQLAVAVVECNAAFAEFNFPRATTAIYNLWWYQFCDVYLECIKPVFQSKESSRLEITRNVLFTCLHTGLCLISPFMPFLSEELYQRLPRRKETDAPSICVARYPEDEVFSAFVNPEVDEKFKFGQKIISEIRSAKGKYDIPHKTRIEISLQPVADDLELTLLALSGDIATLSCSSSVKVSSDRPKGSVPTPVGASCIVWMKLKGMVDLAKCEERLVKKMKEVEKKVEALNKEMSRPNYEKAPEEVRLKNLERMSSLKVEVEQSKEALEQITALKEETD